jgi:hypothetical protein
MGAADPPKSMSNCPEQTGEGLGQAMTVSITDEIIDAIIRNQGCQIDRPEKAQGLQPWRATNLAALKSDWETWFAVTKDDLIQRMSGSVE